MTYAAQLTRHYAEVRSRLMRPEPKERMEFIAIEESVPMTFLPPPPMQHWRRIVEEVACKHGLTAAMLTGRDRKWTLARGEAMWRIRQEVRLGYGQAPSLKQMGRWFDGRDHSSVLHCIGRYRESYSDIREPR